MYISAEYVNHLGEVLDFNEHPFHFNGSKTADWEYAPTTLNGRTVGFRQAQVEFPIEIIIAADKEEDGFVARNRIFEISEKDVDTCQAGSLVIDGWRMECWLLRSVKEFWWRSGASAVMTLGVLSDDPVWTREHSFNFWPTTSGGAKRGSDHPYDYPHDYRASSARKTINNPGFKAAPIKITIYGPCDTPRLMLGGNVYEVAAPLEEGDLLTIDGRGKTITRVRRNGFVEAVFSQRRGVQRCGSGSFIFQPLPPGISEVSWDGSFGFDVVVCEQRAERRWG